MAVTRAESLPCGLRNIRGERDPTQGALSTSEKPDSSIPQAMHAACELEGKREAFQRAGVQLRRGGENLLALQDQSGPLALKIRREKGVSGQTICSGSQCPVFSVFFVSI